MLQRVPVILAVTAGAYGLPVQARETRAPHAKRTATGSAGHDKPAAAAQAQGASAR